MRDEEIANAVAKKLRLFTFVERHVEMLLDLVFGREKFLNYEIGCFLRWLNANCPAHHLIDRS